jgi:hypothetical protein
LGRTRYELRLPVPFLDLDNFDIGRLQPLFLRKADGFKLLRLRRVFPLSFPTQPVNLANYCIAGWNTE